MKVLKNAFAFLMVTLLSICTASAQPNAFIPGFGDGGGNNVFGRGLGVNAPPNQNQQQGFGGGQNADFESLIDLIQSTVASETWVDNGGPEADIRPFPGGVWVDASGLLREFSSPKIRPVSLSVPAVPSSIPQGDVRQTAKLRCISLPRLEAAIYHHMRDDKPLDESMLVLAGLQRVEYIFLYPEIGDIVIAGPAGDWRLDSEHRLVSADTNAPVVRLDDLITLLRRERDRQHKPFGCSINPRQANLAKTQAYLSQSSTKPLKPGKRARERWLDGLRESLGRQDIEVFGMDAGTHAAHVLVKADHHMKQVGIGLADGVPGVESYLDTVARRADAQPAMNVLRWWFSTNYTGVARNESGTAIELTGPGVCVLSENELLTKRGERIHTGKADDATQGFAHSFTNEFEALSRKYPVYGELRNVFDLAILAALLDGEDLYSMAGWQPVLFHDAKHLPLPKYPTPKEVDTIMNHRVVEETKILAAVSGGVWFDSRGVLKGTAEPSDKLEYYHRQKPEKVEPGTWWWDLE